MADSDLTDWLARVAAKSATLAERQGGAARPVMSAASQQAGAGRLAYWLAHVARGDESVLQRRLAWDGWTQESVLPWLGEVEPPAGEAPAPEWAQCLREALETGFTDGATAGIAGPPFFLPEAPLAFEEAFPPFLATARRRVRSAAGAAGDLLTPSAWQALERHLLAYLSRRAERTLFLEFSNEREATRVVAQFQGRPETAIGPGRDLYDGFVRRLYAERKILDLLGEYVVLARQLGILVQLWVEAVAELLLRLAADRTRLAETFFGGRDPGIVTGVQPFLSDRHFQGRGVMILQFASGDRVVYKPKGIPAEAAYQDLLAWCNTRGAPLPLKTLRVWDRGTHGWVEYVENLPCPDRAAVERYYTRAGMFLCLVYALEATDCHYENIIACGEHPILIDLETIMHGRPHEGAARVDGAHELANQQMLDSVLRTAFLPRWEFGPNGESYDISGLAGGAGMVTPFLASSWRGINTDAMALTQEPIRTMGEANAPRQGGQRADYGAFGAELLEGFSAMYRFLIAQRSALLEPDGPLERAELKRTRLRFLLRHTKVYFSLLKNSSHPDRLRDGADLNLHYDVLCRAFVGEGEKPEIWPVVARELADLAALDVPYFHTFADSRDLHLGPEGPVVPGYFSESGHAAARRRIEGLDEEDLERQLLYIKSTLHAREALSHQGAPRAGLAEVLAPEDSPLLTSAGCLAVADEIGRELARRAIRAKSGRSVTWVSFEFIEEAGRYELLPMGYRLYEGVTGPAVFLAALARATGRDDYRALAIGSLFTLRQALREAPARIAEQIGIGAGMGLASVAYALTQVATFLDLPELADEAALAVRQITPEIIARDRRFDLLFGSAGALLALLVVPSGEPDGARLGRIAACADHLLRARVASAEGPRAWPTGHDRGLLTGFSHGAAGIAYALARAAAVTGREEFLAAAREAVAFEDGQYVKEEGNWLDHRTQPAGTPGMPLCSWCHGAPGILLGRAAGLPWLDGVEIRADLENAARTTEGRRIEFLDQLCCGNLGRAEILGVAGALAGRAEWVEAGRKLSARVAARAALAGGFGVNWRGGPFHAGFFQGITGVGYHYLRLADPARHPSVLCWQ